MGDAVAEEYKSSLADLTCNSKVLINVLTMLAEENIKYAVNIVETIANHVELCSPDRKLPCLYLIDSIVKNVGQEYLTIFSQHIVSMFASVFQKVDERTRAQMYKLRITWNTVFPNKILYALDLKTKQVDPAWPVNAQPPAHSIHINPKFLGTPLTKGITLNPAQASPSIIQNEENPVKVPQHIIQQLMLREDKTKLLNSKPLLNPEQALPSVIQDEENALKAKQQIVIQLRDKQQKLKLQEEKRLKNSKSLPSAAIAPCVVSTLATGPPYVSKPPVGPSSTVSHIGSALTTIAYNPQVCVSSKLTNDSSLLTVYNPNTLKCDQGHATQKLEAKPSQLVLNVTQTKPLTVAPSKVIVAPNHRDPRQRDPRRAARSNQLASEHTNAVPNALQASNISTSKVSSAVPLIASVVKPVTSEAKVSVKEPTKAKEVAFEATKDGDKKNEAAPSDSKKSSTNLNSDIQIPTSRVEPRTIPEDKTLGGKKRRKVHEQKSKDKHKPATSDTKISPPSTKPSKEKSLEKKKVSPNEKKSSSSHASRNHTEEKRHNTRLRSRSPLHKTDKKSPKSHGISRDPRQRKLSSDHAKRKLDVSSRNGKNDDVDLRRFPNSESDRSSKGPKHDVTSEKTEESYEPPEKKTKEDKESADVEDNVLFGSEDQDYRQLPKDGQKGAYEGWATYKKAHPDEFKTRPLHSRDSIDSNQSTYEDYRNNNEKMAPKSPREICSPNEMEYDRLGRPRLHRMRQLRRSDSIQGCLRRDGEFSNSFQNSYNLHHLLSEQKSILREAEERYQLGHMSKEDFDGIQRGLESISRSTDAFRKEEYGPHSSFPHFLPKNIPRPRHIKSEFKSNPDRIIYNDYNHLPPKQEANAQGPNQPPPAVRTIRLDDKLRNIHFIGDKALVLMDNDVPRQLMFEGKPTEVHIEGLKPILLRFDGKPVELELDGIVHSMKFGAPSRELYINNYPYEGKFGGPPFSVILGNGRLYNISLGGPPPIVQVGKEPAYELYQQYLDQNRSDVDMRLNPNPMAKTDTDWRPMGQKNSVQDDQRSTTGPLFIKAEPPSYDRDPSTSDFEESRFPNRHDDNTYQDPREWKQDHRPLPPELPDVHGPRHPEWRHSPFQDVQMANSPRNTPPRDMLPHSNDWDQSGPPHPYKPEQRPEPMNRPWMPRILGPNSSRFTRPPGPENLFNVPRDNAIQRFEERPYADCPGPPSFRLPLRPPFIIRKIRPEFGNEPISRPLLPPPQHVLPSPWRHPRALKPTENIRHPVLLPPPQPPIHMRMPVPIKQEVPSNSALPVTVPPVSASSSLLPPPPFINLSAAPAELSVSSTVASPTQNFDINSLFSKLLAAGIISKPASDEPEVVVKAEKDKEGGEESEKKEDKEKEHIPPIELKLESLKVKQPGVISSIYRGSQCASCGMRFKEIHGERYSRHLDWHFRMNRREKDGVKKAFSRKWYYEVEDWTQFEEFEDLEERARSFFELQADEQFQIEPVVEVPSVPVSTQETETCVVCGEPFQLFWVEDEEEWHLRNAVRHDEQAYHPSCYEDYVKASLKVETPVEEKSAIDIVKKEPIDEDVKDDLPDATEIKAESIDESVNMKIEEEMAKEISGLVNTVLETIETEEEENRKKEEIKMKEEMLQGKPGEEEVIGLISESDAEMEIAPKEESERVVLGSGGIVMKVRAESLKPASPLVEAVTEKEASVKEAEESEEEEFRPPTPDPRFQVLPPVQRGTELSGLCCIM